MKQKTLVLFCKHQSKQAHNRGAPTFTPLSVTNRNQNKPLKFKIDPLLHSVVGIGAQGNQRKNVGTVAIVIAASNEPSFISDPGVLCLLLALMNLRQARLQVCNTVISQIFIHSLQQHKGSQLSVSGSLKLTLPVLNIHSRDINLVLLLII